VKVAIKSGGAETKPKTITA